MVGLSLSPDKSAIERAKLLLVKARVVGYDHVRFQDALRELIEGEYSYNIDAMEKEFDDFMRTHSPACHTA